MGCSCYLEATQGVGELDLTFRVALTDLLQRLMLAVVSFYDGTCPRLPNDILRMLDYKQLASHAGFPLCVDVVIQSLATESKVRRLALAQGLDGNKPNVNSLISDFTTSTLVSFCPSWRLTVNTLFVTLADCVCSFVSAALCRSGAQDC